MDIDPLRHHLAYNIYPPVPDEFYDTIKGCVEYAARGEWERVVTMPNGVEMMVERVIDDLRLDEMVQSLIDETPEYQLALPLDITDGAW